MRGAAGGAAEPQNRASQRRIGLFRGRDTRRLVRVTTGPLRASQENHRDSGFRGRDSPASGATRTIVRDHHHPLLHHQKTRPDLAGLYNPNNCSRIALTRLARIFFIFLIDTY